MGRLTGLVGELEELVRDDGVFAIVTDHGYSGLELDDRGQFKIGQHMHSDRGLWIINGPGVVPGARVDGGSLIDFAPTVMEAAGIPIPEVVEGAARGQALRR